MLILSKVLKKLTAMNLKNIAMAAMLYDLESDLNAVITVEFLALHCVRDRNKLPK